LGLEFHRLFEVEYSLFANHEYRCPKPVWQALHRQVIAVARAVIAQRVAEAPGLLDQGANAHAVGGIVVGGMQSRADQPIMAEAFSQSCIRDCALS
jgi:hypothetical protein